MNDQDLSTSLDALWGAAAPEAPTPEWPEKPIDALVAFLDGVAPHSEFSRHQADLTQVAAHLHACAVGHEQDLLLVARSVSHTISFTTPWLQGLTFYVDRARDEEENHRVYLRDEEVEQGLPLQNFASLEIALAWLVRVVAGEQTDFGDRIQDEWEAGPDSAGFALEAMLEMCLPLLWSTVRDAKWPSPAEHWDGLRVYDQQDRSKGWQRRACLAAMAQVVVDPLLPMQLPRSAFNHMGEVERHLISHLQQLQKAAQGVVPPMMTSLASGSTHFATAAQAWIEGFRAARSTGPAPAQTSFESELQRRLSTIVRDMESRELVEVEPIHFDALLTELVNACLDAKHPKAMIRKAVKVFVHSPLVEEVYASDPELADALKRGLGDAG